MISYNVFMSFVDENGDASKLLSKECYKRWMASRRTTPKQPEESFRRVLTAHVCGVDGRRPFPPKVEASLLKVLRKKEVWDCFKDTPYSIGIRGFRNQGLHEASAKSNHRGNLRSRARKKYFDSDDEQDGKSARFKKRRRKLRRGLSSDESDDEDDDGSEAPNGKKSRRSKNSTQMPSPFAYYCDPFGRPVSYPQSGYVYSAQGQMQAVKMVPYPVQPVVYAQPQQASIQAPPTQASQQQTGTTPTTLQYATNAPTTFQPTYLPLQSGEQYIHPAFTQLQTQQQVQTPNTPFT